MKLFEPITINGMTVKNRIVMPGMGVGFGIRNSRAQAYYEERAKGGVGLMVVAGIMPDALADDQFARGFHEWIAKPVQKYGTKIGPQLWYGNQYPSFWKGGIIPDYVAPSAGSPPGARMMLSFFQDTQCYCRELTIAEIKDIISRYVAASVKAKEVGFDFIEMHGCHGHILPHQFFSPVDNRRKDEYGGSLVNRMRFSIELAKAIRKGIGKNYPFLWRLCAEENLPGGYTFEECTQLCIELEKAGVDTIDVSWGHEHVDETAPVASYAVCPGEERPAATFVPHAETIKKKLKIPVIGVGRIHTPALAEEILQGGRVDMVAVGRQLLADPEWPNKAMENRLDDIKPCILCNHCIRSLDEGPVSCSINPRMGKEEQTKIVPAAVRKSVLVIGGGPAGMEAARIAAMRGHKVTLYEKSNNLGGQLTLASKPPLKRQLGLLAQYYQNQLGKLGVTVKINEEAAEKNITKVKPDAVILAAGSSPTKPEIPGINGKNVVTFDSILTGTTGAGENVLVIGGGQVGCETAEFLVEQGKKVTIVEMLDSMAANIAPRMKQYLLFRLGARGVKMLTGAKCENINDDGATIINRAGRKLIIKADTIVIATGSSPNNRLSQILQTRKIPVITVGDCVSPRRIINAIEEGAKAGREV